MQQLTGLDAGFLYMETATTFGHISSLSIYSAPADGESPYELFRNRIEERLPVLTPLRRRLVDVPFQLDHPWWIEDPDFDLDFHIRHIAVPPPGGEKELSALVGRLISRPLDRSRPLWEAYVIEGLPGDEWAAVIKMHHATVDGAAGTLMTLMLLDTAPDAPAPPMPELPAPESVPTAVEMMGRTMANYAQRPQRYLAAQGRLLKDAYDIAVQNGDKLQRAWLDAFRWPGLGGVGGGGGTDAEAGGIAEAVQAAPTAALAPRTPFNKSITPHRRLAYRSFSLTDIKAIKNHFGVTLNDVVMAVCAGALRRYLDRHEALPEQPLVAAVPVSIRTGEEEEMWTNRVSSVFSTLPTHLDDPAERVQFTHDSMATAKGNHDMVPAESLIDFAQFAPPAVFAQAASMMTRMRMADQLRQVSNLVISNVPGPREPMYMGTARLQHYYPVSTIAEGQGLNITVQSYEDKLDLGLVGCRELLPDLTHLLDDVETEIETLLAQIP